MQQSLHPDFRTLYLCHALFLHGWISLGQDRNLGWFLSFVRFLWLSTGFFEFEATDAKPFYCILQLLSKISCTVLYKFLHTYNLNNQKEHSGFSIALLWKSEILYKVSLHIFSDYLIYLDQLVDHSWAGKIWMEYLGYSS
jgi:hypothetical protein